MAAKVIWKQTYTSSEMLASTLNVAALESGVTPIRKAFEKPPMKSDAAGEGEAVAVKRPEDGYDAYGVEHLHQHREHVLGAHEAAIEQRKAGDRHQQHQHRRRQHPGVVALVDSWLRIGSGRGEQADREGRQSRAIGTLERHLVYS